MRGPQPSKDGSIDPKTFGIEHAEKITRAESEVRWKRSMLELHLKSLRQCVSPSQARRNFYGLSLEMRAEAAEALLGEIARDLSGLLRHVNDARQSAKDFVAEARGHEGRRVLPGSF